MSFDYQFVNKTLASMKLLVKSSLILVLVFNCSMLSAQIKLLTVSRTDKAPKIDGILDEDNWTQAPVGSDFIEYSPEPNSISEQKSDIRVLYDDKAIYIGAQLFDTNPRNIKKQLGIRDEINVNADRFEVYLDPFMSGQNAFMFGVTAAGVELDSRITPDGEEFVWDAVWKPEVKINEDGWTVEMRIPYSAFRFPRRDFQTWGINFKRVIRNSREHSYYNPVIPEIDGFVNQFGILQGMAKIKAPVRFSLTPFVAANFKYVPTENREAKAWNSKFTGGLDWKFGINESYTLDMTVIPNFGEVVSDDVELNLSPYELKFEERRPFFTEGLDIFDRGGIFYSRRVGDQTIRYNQVNVDSTEILVENPRQAVVLNAMKISGRNRNGLGVGVFNGITGSTKAVIEKGEGSNIFREEETNPLSNYNLIIIDQLFENNSFISFINSNVVRKGGYRDANVTGTEFRYATKNNQYAVFGKGLISQLFLRDDNDDPIGRSGYAYTMGFGKVSGNFRFNLWRDVQSDTYDPNDLGFLLRNNMASNVLQFQYNIYKPFNIFNNLQSEVSFHYDQLNQPNTFSSFRFEGKVTGTLKNFMTVGVSSTTYPGRSNDFYEARTEGQKFVVPASMKVGGFFSSDYRKAVAVDFDLSYQLHSDWGRKALKVGVAPRFRLSNRFSVIPGLDYEKIKHDRGYAGNRANGQIMFGERDLTNVTGLLTANYLFSKKMAVSLRARYYWAFVDYDYFRELNEDGLFDDRNYDYTIDQNGNKTEKNFHALNIDLVYRYRFAPGSEINLIWKHSVLEDNLDLNSSFGQSWSNFRENSVGQNLFTVKVLYYLDYLKIKRSRAPVEF